MTCWAITGSSGFIGRALIRDLTTDGIAVRGLSRGAQQSGHSVRGDIRDPSALDELLKDADVVVHLAAYVHRSASSVAEIRECWSVNRDGTQALVGAMARHCPSAFLVFVSSAGVYTPSERVLDESAPTVPATPYGQSKLSAENIVATSGLRETILRPALVFGRGAPGNLARLTRMLRFRFALEMNRGTPQKSIVPVENLVAAIRAVVRDQRASAGEIFNVAGSTMTMRQISDALAESLGVHPLHIPVSTAVAERMVRAADPVLRLIPGFPSLPGLVRAYGSSSILDDAKLRSRTTYVPVVDTRVALARSTT